MKYYRIYQIKNDDEFLIGTTDDIFEAQGIARAFWDHLTHQEQRYNEIEIRHYLYDIEDENCGCYDYDIAPEAWYYWYAVVEDEDDYDHGYGSFDWYEAYNMASDMYKLHPNARIVTVDYRDDYCIEDELFEDIRERMSIY